MSKLFEIKLCDELRHDEKSQFIDLDKVLFIQTIMNDVGVELTEIELVRGDNIYTNENIYGLVERIHEKYENAMRPPMNQAPKIPPEKLIEIKFCNYFGYDEKYMFINSDNILELKPKKNDILHEYTQIVMKESEPLRHYYTNEDTDELFNRIMLKYFNKKMMEIDASEGDN